MCGSVYHPFLLLLLLPFFTCHCVAYIYMYLCDCVWCVCVWCVTVCGVCDYVCFVSSKLCVLVHDVMSECECLSLWDVLYDIFHSQTDQERQFSSKHYLSNANKTHTVDTGNCIPRIYMYMYALPPLREKQEKENCHCISLNFHVFSFSFSLA